MPLRLWLVCVMHMQLVVNMINAISAVAKARARQNDRQLKNSASQGSINRRKLQGQTKRSERSAILRNARDYLGMGTDMFR